ncbi:MAG: hypothetical protein LBH14_07765 [Desulfobulbaceae bacterium]|jgi:hypothetical protein|nr:hypothetical protein [Desulfobulbaceae bacterium]
MKCFFPLPRLLLAAIAILPPVCADAQALGASVLGIPALVIHNGGHEVFSDGTLLARYRLSFDGENPNGRCQDIQAFWRPGSAFQPGRRWLPLPIRCDSQNCEAEIHMGGIVFLTLLAQARCAGIFYQAQTIDTLHARNFAPGGSWAAAGGEPASVIPSLELIPAPAHYYPQTGMTFSFRYPKAESNLEITSNDVAGIIDAGGTGSNGVAMKSGDFSFTLSHDPALNRQGFEATSERIIVVRERAVGAHTGQVSAFTLNVHRSRYAFLRPESGMALFVAVAAVSVALVISLKKQSWRR